ATLKRMDDNLPTTVAAYNKVEPDKGARYELGDGGFYVRASWARQVEDISTQMAERGVASKFYWEEIKNAVDELYEFVEEAVANGVLYSDLIFFVSSAGPGSDSQIKEEKRNREKVKDKVVESGRVPRGDAVVHSCHIRIAPNHTNFRDRATSRSGHNAARTAEKLLTARVPESANGVLGGGGGVPRILAIGGVNVAIQYSD
ncbi:hypothetical protein TeGR_g11733, partial [Tetraparma gracilis]